jgi:hypothetical protein
MKKWTSRTWACAAAGACLLAGAGSWRAIWDRSYPARDFVAISWRDGGSPAAFTFEVTDGDHRPLPAVAIVLEDSSGGGAGDTDANGRWVYRPDREMLVVKVNGVVVFRRDGAFASWLAPVPGHGGTTVHVVIRDLDKFPPVPPPATEPMVNTVHHPGPR